MSIPVIVGGGHVRRIEFSGYNPSYYTTDDEDEQRAIEDLPSFGKTITTVFVKGVVKSEGEIEEPNNEGNGNEGFLSIQELREHLIKDHDIPYQGLNNPQAIISKAEALGLNVESLKSLVD